MIAELPISPISSGLEPLTSAGNMNFTRMKPAKPRPSRAAKPRQRATKITAAAKAMVMTSSGTRRSKSESWYCAGWPSGGRDPDQFDVLAHFGAGAVELGGERYFGHRLADLVALEKLDVDVGADLLGVLFGRPGQARRTRSPRCG